jgi:hypothetical protein
MPDDPKAARQLAILQSLTTEAGGFYTLIVTVASSFLGGSLLFLEKFALNRNRGTLLLLILAWVALVAAIGCVARLRYHNLRSARFALEERFSDASQIDQHTDRLSWLSQYLLIGGMLGLVVVGSATFYTQQGERKNSAMNEQKQAIATGNEQKSIPYGSLGTPSGQAVPAPAQPNQAQQVPQPNPQQGAGQQTGSNNGK